MAASLPPGTTFPRGLPNADSIQWPLIPARELFELKYGKALVEADRRPGSIPVYGTNGRCGGHDKALFAGPGVILGRKGQGPLGVEWCDTGYWVIDTAYSLALLRSDVNLKYAYFLIKFVGLNHLKDGTSNPTLSRDAFGAQAFPLPPLAVQRAIAHILGMLDDKIELNRRMNETLEAMARALFKSWFVNFDPVRAMAEGRNPCLSQPIANLFPDRFEDSELGKIPAGWKVGTLEGFAELNPEVWAKDAAPDAIEYVDLANTKWGKIETIQRYLWQDAPSRAQRVLRLGDTIVGMVRPGNGSFCLVAEEGLTGSTGFAVLRPRKAIYAQYIYLAATLSDNIDRLSHLADGAAYPAVRPDVVLATQAVLPGEFVIECFARVAKPLMERMAENERASRTLATLRDMLLPKLISGELQVKDAGHFIGRAS